MFVVGCVTCVTRIPKRWARGGGGLKGQVNRSGDYKLSKGVVVCRTLLCCTILALVVRWGRKGGEENYGAGYEYEVRPWLLMLL